MESVDGKQYLYSHFFLHEECLKLVKVKIFSASLNWAYVRNLTKMRENSVLFK